MDILKNKWVESGIVAVLLCSGVYYFWNGGGSDALLTASGEGTSPLSQEILTTLSQLHTIKLDPALFADPAFVSLNDFSTTIPPQQAGRRNPFAPVGASTKASSATAPAAR